MVAAPTHQACTQDKNPGVGLCEWGESQDIYHGASEDANGEKTRGGDTHTHKKNQMKL